MAASYYLSLVLIASLPLKFTFCKEYIPVLFWSDQNYLYGFESVSANQHTNLYNLNHNYMSELIKMNPKVILVFIESQFSLEHFVEYGNVYGIQTNKSAFHNLQNYMEGDFLMLPSVAHPSHSLEYLKSHVKGQIYERESNQSVSELYLDPDHTNLIVIRLPHGKHNYNHMAELDIRIGQITKEIRERTSQYIALFTANKSSKNHFQNKGHIGRHLLQENSNANMFERFFVNASCILMAAQNITIIIFEDNEFKVYDLPQTSDIVISPEASCSNSTPSLFVSFGNIKGNFTSLNISFSFNVSTWLRYWKFTSISVEFKRPNKPVIKQEVSFPSQKLSRGFSFHCSRPYPFHSLNLSHSTDVPLNLTILEFQIQPIDVKHGFSDWDDCEEFFSIGIWMGWFVSFILLIILFCGVVMVMSIKTMDRFDDPKRKTITVTNTE